MNAKNRLEKLERKGNENREIFTRIFLPTDNPDYPVSMSDSEGMRLLTQSEFDALPRENMRVVTPREVDFA